MWRYPMHYIGYHTYGIHGMMLNEFEDTTGWDCPCTLQPGGCPEEDCSINGEAVRPALPFPQTPAYTPLLFHPVERSLPCSSIYRAHTCQGCALRCAMKLGEQPDGGTSQPACCVSVRQGCGLACWPWVYADWCIRCRC